MECDDAFMYCLCRHRKKGWLVFFSLNLGGVVFLVELIGDLLEGDADVLEVLLGDLGGGHGVLELLERVGVELAEVEGAAVHDAGALPGLLDRLLGVLLHLLQVRLALVEAVVLQHRVHALARLLLHLLEVGGRRVVQRLGESLHARRVRPQQRLPELGLNSVEGLHRRARVLRAHGGRHEVEVLADGVARLPLVEAEQVLHARERVRGARRLLRGRQFLAELADLGVVVALSKRVVDLLARVQERLKLRDLLLQVVEDEVLAAGVRRLAPKRRGERRGGLSAERARSQLPGHLQHYADAMSTNPNRTEQNRTDASRPPFLR
mmetsp:Transcript_6026/g.12712  ORF Transcript_6026/g.12712 Transcript_6026/m.12712 type:complete len:322 (+) Transcript_6026:281-1246(+)